MFGCGLALGAVLVVVAGPAAGQNKVSDVQLDQDRPRERVVVQKKPCKNVSSYGCSRLLLRDGKRQAVLTPFTQRPRYPYGWRVRRVRFPDLTGDGRAEVLWALETAGATVSSPSLKGVHQWDGRRARRIFRFSNSRKPPTGYSYVVFVSSRIVPASGSGPPEIETRESLLDRDDSNCCPSAYRVIRHRWNGKRIAPVPGSTRIEPA